MVYIRPVDSIATMFLPLSNTVFGGALGRSIQKGATECSGLVRLGDLAHRSNTRSASRSTSLQPAIHSLSNCDSILDHRILGNNNDAVPDEVLLPVEVFDTA